MPPHMKNYNSQYKNYRRKQTLKSMSNVASTASTALRLATQVYGMVNSERMLLPLTSSDAVTTTAGITHLTPIAQGDSNISRTGNSILAKTLNMQMEVVMHNSATSTFFRILVIQDKQQVADTPPTIADILEASSSTNSIYEINTHGRFKILKNYHFSLDTYKARSKVIKFHYKFPKTHHIRYNGSASSDIQKNGVYLVLLSNEATNAGNVNWYSTFTYHDN